MVCELPAREVPAQATRTCGSRGRYDLVVGDRLGSVPPCTGAESKALGEKTDALVELGKKIGEPTKAIARARWVTFSPSQNPTFNTIPLLSANPNGPVAASRTAPCAPTTVPNIDVVIENPGVMIIPRLVVVPVIETVGRPGLM